MKKIFHLGNCTTCQAIIKEAKIDGKGFEMHEIKMEKITTRSTGCHEENDRELRSPFQPAGFEI
jgi:hypothetical protein